MSERKVFLRPPANWFYFSHEEHKFSAARDKLPTELAIKWTRREPHLISNKNIS